MSILIRQALVNGRARDIYIEGNCISEVSDRLAAEAEHKIDARGMLALPGLVNGHTHSAMSLFRGFADDMALDEWLSKKIWPLEQKLKESDVYWGTRLACLEMIKTGTTFFNDMYWHPAETAKAAADSGLRAKVSSVMIDLFDKRKAMEQIKETMRLSKQWRRYPSRVSFALGPHALYTVSAESLVWCREFAEKNRLTIHFHLSETKKEVAECMRSHGKRPVEYLSEIGFLSPCLVAAHAVHLNRAEIRLLAENRVRVVHNPVSNMKLAVGGVFPYKELRQAGVAMAIGTDGCASNNNLDLLEEVKVAALLQKHHRNDPTALPASEALQMATQGGAEVFGLNAGIIEAGRLADMILVDLKAASMRPNHNTVSNLVYSADGSCVNTTICDGRILMHERHVDGEEEVLAKATAAATELVKR